MVAIMVAALLGAGLSTLVLSPFGGWAVLLGIPLMGSAAALACAAVIYVLKDDNEDAVSREEEPFVEPLPRAEDASDSSTYPVLRYVGGRWS